MHFVLEMHVADNVLQVCVLEHHELVLVLVLEHEAAATGLLLLLVAGHGLGFGLVDIILTVVYHRFVAHPENVRGGTTGRRERHDMCRHEVQNTAEHHQYPNRRQRLLSPCGNSVLQSRLHLFPIAVGAGLLHRLIFFADLGRFVRRS